MAVGPVQRVTVIWRRYGLLLLLEQDLRLLIAFEKQRPFFVGRKLLVGREKGLRRGDAHPHLQFGLGPPLHRPEGGRDVRVVAADGGPDVAAPGHEVVGRIEADPAELRAQRFNPRVRGAFGRSIVVRLVVNR